MKKSIFVIVLAGVLFFGKDGNAQVTFSSTPDTINIVKDIAFDFFYDYVLFENNTSDTLYMRWKKVFLEVDPLAAHGGTNGWQLAIQDPTQYHPSVYGMDSADFYLPTIPTGTTNKFILHVTSNGLVGTLYAKYLFYPIDNLSDTSSVILNYEGIDVVSTQEFSDGKIEVAPNPASDFIKIKNLSTSRKEMKLMDLNGRIWFVDFLEANTSREILTNNFPSGIYFLVFEKNKETVIQKIVIQ
ncbi:MAG: T9SS type A sorting domain-containing protein [Saprospiraceae bacterium]